MSAPEYVFRIRKDAIHANTPEEFLGKAKVDVISVKEKRVILRAISIVDVMGKLGAGPLGKEP